MILFKIDLRGSNHKVQPCVTLVEILGFFNIQIEDKGEIRVKKKIVAGVLGIVIVAGVFGVGYFAGQAGGLKTVDTPYSQSTSEKNENASSAIDVEDISQSTATTDAEGTSHSQSTAESMPSVTSLEDTQPRSRISNDINLTYSYDESTGVLSIDWDRLAKNEYMDFASMLGEFNIIVQYSLPENSSMDFNLEVDKKELCHFVQDWCMNNVEDCRNPGAYSVRVRYSTKLNDIDDFYVVNLGYPDGPSPFEISWYDSDNNQVSFGTDKVGYYINHLELRFIATGNMKIEKVDVVNAQTNLNRAYLNADLYDKMQLSRDRITDDSKEEYLMHTSNYWDICSMAKEEYEENASCGTTEDTDDHNEIVELD